jgi:uncharacterized membrane protein YhaH (DUF805 family)
MNFSSAVKTVLSKYIDFQGRAIRSEYWYWILALVLLSIVLAIIEGAVLAPALGFEPFAPEAGQPLRMVMVLAILLPTFAVTVRRLHDIDRSGWWLFLQLVPVIGALILLWWYIQPGTETQNNFGPTDSVT